MFVVVGTAALPEASAQPQTSTQVIAITGDAAPDSNDSFLDFVGPALNDSGQAAFLTFLTGTSGGFNDNTGMFFFNDGLGLLQVARTGDNLLGSTIVGLNFNAGTFAGNSSDELSDLNEFGQIAYRFDLADGRSGIAVWSAPESGTTYATWAQTHAGGQGAILDFDGDGVANGVEYFMGEIGSTFTPNPQHIIQFDGCDYEIAPTSRKSVTVLFHPRQKLWVLEHSPKLTWPPILGHFTL